jgi:DNA-binding XRE family transcriptional regulator
VSAVSTKRSALRETDNPEWAAWHAGTQLVDVEYVGKMDALVFRFGDGRIFGLSVQQLQGLDPSPVTRVSLVWEGDVALIEQFSGNRLEVPWDQVLYLADPTYEYREPEPGSPDWIERRAVDQEIGERVRLERRRRNWTLAELSSHTGIKVPNLSRLERGKHTPSLDTLDKVATAFGLPIVALVAQRAARPAPQQVARSGA